MTAGPMHEAKQAMVSAMSSWHQGKLFVENGVGVSNDALHVLAGVLLWMGAALLARKPLSSWLPWMALAAVLVWNELVDLCIEQWPDARQQYGESLKDLLLTLAVPTLMMLASRYRPQLFRAGERRR